MQEEEWLRKRNETIKYLKSSRGGQVTSPADYVAKFSSYDPDDPKFPKSTLEEMAAGQIDDSGLKGFCRIYPRNRQDLMAIFTNPKLSVNNFQGSDNHRLSSEDDLGTREDISVRGSYITDQKTGATCAQRMLGLLVADPDSHLSKQTAGDKVQRAGHDEIYCTNFYKFATEEADMIPDWAIEEDIALHWLKAEINSINPETIVVFGNRAWKDGLSQIATRTGESGENIEKRLSETSITDVQCHEFRYKDSDTELIPVGHPTGSATSYSDCREVSVKYSW